MNPVRLLDAEKERAIKNRLANDIVFLSSLLNCTSSGLSAQTKNSTLAAQKLLDHLTILLTFEEVPSAHAVAGTIEAASIQLLVLTQETHTSHFSSEQAQQGLSFVPNGRRGLQLLNSWLKASRYGICICI